MTGIITITIDTAAITANAIGKLDAEIASLGLHKTLPATEGGELKLPTGTYGKPIEIGAQMDELNHYYRNLVGIMRKLNLKGKYFVNVATNASYVCGEL